MPHAGICAGGGLSEASRIGSITVVPSAMSKGHPYRDLPNRMRHVKCLEVRSANT